MARKSESRKKTNLSPLQAFLSVLTLVTVLGGGVMLIGGVGQREALACDQRPQHAFVLSDHAALTDAQRDDALAEIEERAVEAAEPGARIGIYEAKNAKGLREVVEICLVDPPGDGFWLFRMSQTRFQRLLQEAKEVIRTAVKNSAPDVAAQSQDLRKAVSNSSQSLMQTVRKTARAISLQTGGTGPETLTYLGKATGFDGRDPGPRAQVDPVLNMVLLAARFDDHEQLQHKLEIALRPAVSDVIAIDHSLPPPRDERGCRIGAEPKELVLVSLDITGAVTDTSFPDAFMQELATEFARLGPEGRLDVHPIDGDPDPNPSIYTSCLGEMTPEGRAQEAWDEIVSKVGQPANWSETSSPLIEQIVGLADALADAKSDKAGHRMVIVSDMIENSLVDRGKRDLASVKSAWTARYPDPRDALAGKLAGIETHWVPLQSVEATYANGKSKMTPDHRSFADEILKFITTSKPLN